MMGVTNSVSFMFSFTTTDSRIPSRITCCQDSQYSCLGSSLEHSFDCLHWISNAIHFLLTLTHLRLAQIGLHSIRYPHWDGIAKQSELSLADVITTIVGSIVAIRLV